VIWTYENIQWFIVFCRKFTDNCWKNHIYRNKAYVSSSRPTPNIPAKMWSL